MEEFEIKHAELIRKYLAECTLFLARDNNFPLEKPGKIVLAGCGARHTIKGGTGSGDVNSRKFFNIEESLINNGFEVVNSEFLEKYETLRANFRKDWVESVKKEAKEKRINPIIYSFGQSMPEFEYDLSLEEYEADAAIYVVSRISGEGVDRQVKRGDILLTEKEVKDINFLNKKFSKFLLVINAGGFVDLSEVQEVRNILVLSELGTETGQVLCDIILGKANPSGKLTATWAKIEEYPYETKINPDDTYYSERNLVGYRYFINKKIIPSYPFGFGLSYSNFEISYLKSKIESEFVTLYVNVKNISKFKGKEVVEIYALTKNLDESENLDLLGFEKTKELEENESQELEIKVSLRDISRYDCDNECYYLPKGDYEICVGSSSFNLKPVFKICVEDKIVLKEAKNIFVKNELENIEFSKNSGFLEVFSVSSGQINAFKYEKSDVQVPTEVKILKDKELAFMCCGKYTKGLASIVGNSSNKVPGAAGETSELLEKYFNINYAMADGPAGLRLVPEYFEKKNKKVEIKPNPIYANLIEFSPKLYASIIKSLFFKEKKVPKNTEIKYQYTTALPIATAIAQSFNKEFAYLCGDIVGKEMEIFNVDLWLAPALNIHRTIMCGRNFEYYSEDPLLSGIMAAQFVNGVQKHPNKGAVIKHFACNNQETNRLVSNSVVDEATLRTIYLRGFEYCINHAKPKGVMSSYNLLNGVHTSENAKLIDEFLFDENKFDGIVMTDWVVYGQQPKNGKHKPAESQLVMKTRTSLFMPGSEQDAKQILKEMKKDKELRNKLEENVTRTINLFK